MVYIEEVESLRSSFSVSRKIVEIAIEANEAHPDSYSNAEEFGLRLIANHPNRS